MARHTSVRQARLLVGAKRIRLVAGSIVASARCVAIAWDALARTLPGRPLRVGPAAAAAAGEPAVIRRSRACAHPGTGSQSSSVKQITGARAARTPALRAAAGPRP